MIDAAFDLLAESGLQGLTHRAVDRRAQAPLGTTANYFGSRDALVSGVVCELERRDVELWTGQLSRARTVTFDDLVNSARALVAWQTGSGASLARVRFALMLDRPEVVRQAHLRLQATLREVAEALSGDVPVDESMIRAMTDLVDGAILHRVTVRADDDRDLDGLVQALHRLLEPQTLRVSASPNRAMGG